MATAYKLAVKAEMGKMGFTGKLLDDLGEIVKTESDLLELEVFILENNHLRNNLSIVSEFRKLKMGSQTYNIDRFVNAYRTSLNIDDRKNVLSKLLLKNVELRWAHELDDRLHKGELSLESFYHAFQQEPNLHVRRLIGQAVLDCK